MNIICMHKKNVPAASYLGEEKLRYLDITLLLKGNMHYSLNREPVVLHAGDAVIFQKGDLRQREGARDVEYWSFNVSFDETDNLPYYHGVLRQCISEDLQLILDLAARVSAKESQSTEEMLKNLFLLLYYYLFDKSQDSKDDDVIARIKNYIDAHLSEPLTLMQVGSSVYLSPNHCNHLFKKYTGETITEYIIRKKMECAKDYLLNTDMPLTDISSALGYRHYSYFSRQFKKMMNVTPTGLRQTHIWSEKRKITEEKRG